MIYIYDVLLNFTDERLIEYVTNGVTDVHFGLSESKLTDNSSSDFDDAANWESKTAKPLTKQEELDGLPLTIEDGVLKARYPVNSDTAKVGVYTLWLIGTASNNKEVNTTI